MHFIPLLALLLASFSALTGCGSLLSGDRADSVPPPAASPTEPTTVSPNPDPEGQGTKLEDLPEGDSFLTNLNVLVRNLDLGAYHRAGHHGRGVKIAVLDNGFSGLNHSLGVRLPPNTRLIAGPASPMQDTTHGVKLAEIAYALATGSTTYGSAVVGPEMLLINASGFTNFQAAVNKVIEEKVDIVLYAQVWEFGGNFNGWGFINKEVNRAVAAGVLWVNAAGNFGQSTFNAPVVLQANQKDVTLANGGKYVRMIVPRDGMQVTTVLSWNDFKDTKDYKTSQDLDLILEDAQHRPLAASRLRQSGPSGDPKKDTNYSAHAREQLPIMLNAGIYNFRVEAISHNFSATSRLRLAADGDGVRFADQSLDDTVMIPADNPGVLTVGATDVDYSGKKPATDGERAKPEASVQSLVTFSDGESHRGTSAATAIVVGALAVYQSAHGKLDRAQVLEAIDKGLLTLK